MFSWQDPSQLVLLNRLARSQQSAPLASRAMSCNKILLAALVSLSVAGCSSMRADPQASLCAPSGDEAESCEAPRKVVSLTLPRPDLMTKVEIPETETRTASVGEDAVPAPAEPMPAAAASTAAESAPEAAGSMPTPLPAAAPAVAPPVQESHPDTGIEASKPEESGVQAKTMAESAAADKKATIAKETEKSALKSDDKISPFDELDRKTMKRQSADRLLMERGAPGGVTSLHEAIRLALGDHPLIHLAGARVNEANSSISISEAALYPQLEGRLGAGPGVTGTYGSSANLSYFANKSSYGATRGEASLSGKQILYDFGSIQSDVAKSSQNYASETLKFREQTDSVVFQVADVYMQIMQQRELLQAAIENVTALEKIGRLVEENEKNGNGTVADLKRVRSRLIDSQTAQADAKSELQTAGDKFLRLVRQPPGALRGLPNLVPLIPPSAEAAVQQITKQSPRVLALEAAVKAAEHERDAQRTGAFPKLTFEADVGAKEYRTLKDRTELDAKGMVVLKYRFMDGGLQSSQLDQLSSRITQAEMRYRNEIDDVTADVRKNYRILVTARGKAASLQDNVQTAQKARQLYDEQFRGGKRTLLELLDIQTTYYTARRQQITNKFEEQKSAYIVLQDLGKLTNATLSSRK